MSLVKNLKINIVSCDDYQWMYIDDKLTETMGHKIEITDFVDEINSYLESKRERSTLYSVYGIDLLEVWVDDDYIEENNWSVPELYSSIPEDAFL